METVIMFSLVLIFGIISLLLKKYDNKKLKIIYLIILPIGVIIFINEIITSSENRYIAIVLVILSTYFIVKGIKELKLKNSGYR